MIQYVLSYWFSTAILRETTDNENGIGQADIDTFILTLLCGAMVVSGAAYLLVRLEVAILTTACCLIVASEAAFSLEANRSAAQSLWRRFSILYFARGALSFAVPLACAWVFGSASASLIGYAVGVLLPTLISRSRSGPFSRRLKYGGIIRCFQRYFPLSVNSIIRQTFDRGDRIVVSIVFGAAAAGVYSLAADVVRRPIQTLGGATQSVVLPRLSRAYSSDQAHFYSIWTRNGSMVIWLSVLASVASFICIDILFLRLMPGKYPEYIRLIALMVAVSASLEALDTFHAAFGLVASRNMRHMPVVYLLAAAAFLLVGTVAWYLDQLLLIPVAVICANLIGVSGVVRLSSRKALPAPFSTPSFLGAGIFLAISITGWSFLPSTVPLWAAASIAIVIGFAGAGLAYLTAFRRRVS